MIKTVGSAGFNPNLGLVFGVNATTAIPADALTYTATVNNTGSTMTLAGVIRAGNNGNIAATVADYYDEVEYYTSANKTWNPLAGKEANELGALGEDWLGKAPVASARLGSESPPRAESGFQTASCGCRVCESSSNRRMRRRSMRGRSLRSRI